MSQLAKTILSFVGLLFLVLVVTFTGYQTWSLLYETSQEPITAAVGLALFEGGMLYWWYTFQKSAEGIAQMAVSLLWAIFGLFLVAGSTGLHLGAVGTTVLGPNTPAKLITLAAIVNLIGKFLYPLLGPETFQNIMTRALEGMVMVQAYRNAETDAKEMAQALAGQISGQMTQRLRIQMLNTALINHDDGAPVLRDADPRPTREDDDTAKNNPKEFVPEHTLPPKHTNGSVTGN